MQKILIDWLKKLFSDSHSAIVGIALGSVFAGGTGVYFFAKSLWNGLINIIQSPTPLWATIALVLLLALYAYLKTGSSHQTSALPLKFLNDEDIKALQIIASLEHPFEKNRYIGQSTLPNLLNLSPQKTQHCLDNLFKADCIHYDTDNYGTYLRGLTDKGRALLERKNLLP